LSTESVSKKLKLKKKMPPKLFHFRKVQITHQALHQLIIPFQLLSTKKKTKTKYKDKKEEKKKTPLPLAFII